MIFFYKKKKFSQEIIWLVKIKKKLQGKILRNVSKSWRESYNINGVFFRDKNIHIVKYGL